jgi:hypothetical protein
MEPTMNQIEDYNGKESQEKRRTVNLVIAGLLVVGFAYASVKHYYNSYTLEVYTPAVHSSSK